MFVSHEETPRASIDGPYLEHFIDHFLLQFCPNNHFSAVVSSDSYLNHDIHHLSKNQADPMWESGNTGVMITFPHSQMIIFSSF